MSCDTHNSDEAASAENNVVKPDLPDGVPPLTSLYLYISNACNLNCRHCWIAPVYSPSRKNGHFLQPEYIKKAIQEAGTLGLRTVKLTGGEPFLHPD
ncbi:MAG: radical SAM protein, partial [Desulfobacterales bacterium]